MDARKIIKVIAVTALIFSPSLGFAIPALQLYMPDGSYSSTSQTWEVNSDGFELWVAGNTDWKGTIFDVKLLAHYFDYDGDTTGNSISISPILNDNPLTTGDAMPALYSGDGTIKYSDANGTPIDYLSKPTAPGETPVYAPLPSPSLANHDEAKMSENVAADSYDTFYLGDFYRTSDAISTYDENYDPNAAPKGLGHIEKFWVEMNGWDSVHFDAFDHVIANNKSVYIKAPFSKDATGGGGLPPGVVPEPSTYLLFGTGLMGLALGFRRKVK